MSRRHTKNKHHESHNISVNPVLNITVVFKLLLVFQAKKQTKQRENNSITLAFVPETATSGQMKGLTLPLLGACKQPGTNL